MPNLKALRRKYEISQQKLADAIGVSQQSINQYENHKVEPEIAVLSRMADYFDTSIDFIVGHTDISRKFEHAETYQLNQEEATIINQYRILKPNEKKCVQHILQTLNDK